MIARRAVRVAVLVLIVLAPLVTGAVGYYLGQQGRQSSEPTSHPVWTDQEIKSLGNGTAFATLRCSYHLADGTVRVVETVILATTVASQVSSRTCPGSP